MSSVTDAHRPWRYRVFGITWLAYAGFYLCRKNFSVAKPALNEHFGFSFSQISLVWTGYLSMYALGQFVNGYLGDVKGPRFMVTLGLITSASMNLLFGFGESIGLFAVLMGINGFAQATGWPGLVKCMGNWFRVKERGRVMGWWCTCYAVGGAFATFYAAKLFGIYDRYLTASVGDEVVHNTWKIVFWGPALTLLCIAALFLFLVRNRPRDAGLTEINEYEGMGSEQDDAEFKSLSPEEEKKANREAFRQVFRSRTVWIYCAVYFCLKFVRYGMLSWLPTYGVKELGYNIESSGILSIGFEFFAPAGVLFCGYMSDKVFGSRRTPICVVSMIGLVIACVLLPRIAHISMMTYFFGLGLIGFTVFGPDAMLSGPAAQDFGSKRAAGMCAGLLNGVGSIGAVIQEPLIGWIIDNVDNGWDLVFNICAGLALVATLIILVTWNDRPKTHIAQG